MKNAFLIACVLLCVVASASADSIVLALSGEPAPGGIYAPSGTMGLYFRFTVPVLNRLGQIAFRAQLEDTTNGEADDMAIFRVDSEEGTPIVQEVSLLPSWETRFASFYLPAINRMGQVAFWAESSEGGTGIYCGTGDAIPTQIVRENELSPDGNGRFDEISKYNLPGLDIMGNVAFRASFKNTVGGLADDSGIVLSSGSIPKVVAREGSDEYVAFKSGVTNVAMSDYGHVAFWASITWPLEAEPVGAIYSGRSSIRMMVREGRSAPGGNGEFSILDREPSIHQYSPNQPASVGFHAFLRNTTGGSGVDDTGLFHCDADGFGAWPVHEIARRGQSPPDSNGEYDLFPTKIALDNKMAAFRAIMRNTSNPALDGDGVYRYYHSGAITETVKMARGGEPAPGGNGVLYKLYQPVMNRGGQVAFEASLWDTVGGAIDDRAIYIGNGLILLEVARKGDPLLGSTITQLHFATGPNYRNGFNRFCQVAYHADLADGRQVLMLDTPLVEWVGDSSGGWPDNANWTLGIEPAAVHDVTIAPGYSVEVGGPRTNATVKSLTIGSGAGNPATLSLVSGGDMTVVNTCTVMPTGNVEIGDGRTLAAGDIVNQGNLTFQSGVGNVYGEAANGPGGSIVVPAGAEAWMHGQVHNQGTVDVAAGAGIHLAGLTGNGCSGGGTVWLGGEVRPGTCIGLMNFGGDVVFDRLSLTYIDLGAAACLPTHDLIVVEGDLMLNGTLVLNSCAAPAWLTPGQSFEIIDVMGTAAGRFLGLDEGAQVAIFDGVPLHITYAGGDRNDVELYAVPEPATLSLLALGACLPLFRRKRR